MALLVLDQTLEVVKPISNYGENDWHALNGVLNATITPGKQNDWGIAVEKAIQPTETVHTIPANADMYHSSYLSYLSRTYAVHSSIVFKPDTFWYTILCEIASVIKADPETYRSVFTSSPDKIDIKVEGVDPFYLPINLIKDELYKLVPVDVDLFLPTFSTTTEMSRIAMLASFLETVSPYYNYMMYLCGHPNVHILGSTEDWDMIEKRLRQLSSELRPLKPWFDKVIKLSSEIKRSLTEENVEFWKTIFTEERCGSGGQIEISGWFASMFIEQPSRGFLHNFPTHITRVPYTVLEQPEYRYELCCGLFSSQENDGVMTPEFSTVVNQYLIDSAK